MDLPVSAAAVRGGLSPKQLSHALASYVRSISSGNSPFDRYINGDRSALSPEQQLGLRIFRGTGNCTTGKHALAAFLKGLSGTIREGSRP